MPVTFFPCLYKSPETGIPCGEFFAEIEGLDTKLCPIHRDTMATTGETKPQYIDARNEEIKYCADMSLEELDKHIAGIEQQIAELKVKYYSARGVRGDKIEKMTDEERAERKKWRSSMPVEPIKVPKPSVKKDPTGHLASKLGLKHSDAKDLMNLDVDALLAKFAQSKEKNV